MVTSVWSWKPKVKLVYMANRWNNFSNMVDHSGFIPYAVVHSYTKPKNWIPTPRRLILQVQRT